MNIEKLFEKFNIPEQWRDRNKDNFVVLSIFIIFILSIIIAYDFYNNRNFWNFFCFWIIGFFISLGLLNGMLEGMGLLMPIHNPEKDFYPNKELLYKDKRYIVSYI